LNGSKFETEYTHNHTQNMVIHTGLRSFLKRIKKAKLMYMKRTHFKNFRYRIINSGKSKIE
jgi:hypothetical protein